ncbi:NADP-dependent oxidoreductase domain-containing protein [Penicillium canariense]|uniref:D-xylose reductase [NAD(P)H] n=1 Tax=Penicillium canariense TaxID=189055 RepID=A0A9W9I611_9EURO|nr:NADP-dependent oxidoreductase domain-containing protein [Penicillium canariense]KAJ5168644.1 NADP-dependent oxidoreductase domain-containing protein [Penicillium canariense]
MGNLNFTSYTYQLNNGAHIPAIGLGTWQSTDNNTREAVKYALQHGYRHIDTALNYGNERQVGEGIRASGVPREQIWLTTKLDNHWHHRAREGLESSLKDLGVDYIDLFLVHFPCSTDPEDRTKHLKDWDFVKTWQDMQSLLETGKVKTIGVSNFQVSHLEKLLSDPSCKVVPAVNQIELHPHNPSPKLLEYCKSKGIHCTAYSCLGGHTASAINAHTSLMEDPTVLQIAKKEGKTPAQIVLMWGLQRGTSVIPKSVTPARIDSNYQLDGWCLTDEQMEDLNGIRTRTKVVGDSWMPIRVFVGDDE